jgi:hypothetical protein
MNNQVSDTVLSCQVSDTVLSCQVSDTVLSCQVSDTVLSWTFSIIWGLPLRFLFTEKSTGIAFKIFIYKENF